MWFDDAPSERSGKGRVQEILETGAETVAVSCPFCMVMISDGIAASSSSGSVHVRDVAEILADSITDGSTPNGSTPNGALPDSTVS